MDCFPTVVGGNSARKRNRNEQLWKRSLEKKSRYCPTGQPKPITCNHKNKPAYRCSEITRNDQQCFYQKFYKIGKNVNNIKITQDSFILKYTKTSTPKRKRIVTNEKGEKSMIIQYFIFKKNCGEKIIPVCQKAFLNTLVLSKNRVIGVVSRYFKSGEMPIERRGGDRKTKIYEIKRKAVINFIKKFKVIENHYCRSKTSSREYLSSDLNVKKMWRMFNAEMNDEAKKVKEAYFRHIFCTNFNIGFGSPQTDQCSTCLSLKEKINRAQDWEEKSKLICEKRCHSLKAKAFYAMLREKRDDLMTVTFDCQKNQVLPRVSDQSAYYSRQIYKYNFTVVVGSSRTSQTKTNVFIYEWDEAQHSKSCNEIGSAVYHCLLNLNLAENIKVLRLASDGCGGQNKNSTMMGIICVWLINYAPKTLKNVEFLFPVVGHSFLPPDRVFARIEKQVIKSSEPIITPDEYSNIFLNHGTVVGLADKVYDWKNEIKKIILQPGKWHFNFNPSKRFYFKRNKKENNVLIRGEVHYRINTGTYRSVCKKDHVFKDIRDPILIESGKTISPLKLKDVAALLKKHFGTDWKSLDILSYYNNIIENEGLHDAESQSTGCKNSEEVEDLVV